MYVRKVRGQNKVGKIVLTAAEIAVVRKLGMVLEDYVKHALLLIAKERRWKWYFNKENT
jgi:hypothetical protein